MPEQRRVEIAGAGLSGLTAACVLAQQGWKVRVHERASELRDLGAGIFVWANGLRALESIGALDDATRRAQHVQRFELRDHRGRLLQSEWLLPQNEGMALCTILRDDLHAALASTARASGAEIVLGSKVVRAEAEGAFELEDGTRLEADLVVGADGYRSRVRDALGLARRVTDLQDGCSRHLVPRSAAEQALVTTEQWNGGRRIGVVPCSPEHTYVFLCCPASDRVGRRDPIDRRAWSAWFPRFGALIEQIDQDTSWAPFHDVVCDGWSRGHAAVIGDAAHAMSPNLGQAICMAMSNAVALGQALQAESDVPAALALWERSERPITDRTQRASRFYGRIGTRWPSQPLLLDARSALLRTLGGSKRLQKQVNRSAHHTPNVAPTR